MRTYFASCHCGSVTIELDHKPEYLNDCNCSLCQSSGALWGYYAVPNVQVNGQTQSYIRADKSTPSVQIHFCPSCGTTSHWSLTESYISKSGISGRMGVNMRLFDESDLIGVQMRFPDGKAWNGEGDYGYRKAAITLGDEG